MLGGLNLRDYSRVTPGPHQGGQVHLHPFFHPLTSPLRGESCGTLCHLFSRFANP